MNNYRNNNRKNRFKSSGDRSYRKRLGNGHKNPGDFSSNTEFRHRNPSRHNQNAAKLVEKYNNLAREALSSGDKILSENYLQHADHFQRVLNERENFKKEKILENKVEQTTDVVNNFTNSDQVKNDIENNEVLEGKNKVKKTEKLALETN